MVSGFPSQTESLFFDWMSQFDGGDTKTVHMLDIATATDLTLQCHELLGSQ